MAPPEVISVYSAVNTLSNNSENLAVLALAVGGAFIYYVFVGNKMTDQVNDGVPTVESLRRGERLNNPLNIEKGEKWQGLASDQPDSRFAKFSNPVYGIRAAVKLIMTYRNKYGLDTISKIINRWAPSNENNTVSYINTVSTLSGVGANEKLNYSPSQLASVVRAMIKVEQGRIIYSSTIINQGVQLGLA